MKVFSKFLLSAILSLSFACDKQILTKKLEQKIDVKTVSEESKTQELPNNSFIDIELSKSILLVPLFDRNSKLQGYNLSFINEDSEVFLSLSKDNPTTFLELKEETIDNLKETGFFTFNDNEYDFGMIYQKPEKEDLSDEKIFIKLGNKIFILDRFIESNKDIAEKDLLESNENNKDLSNQKNIKFKLAQVKDSKVIKELNIKFENI
jgi:hypothetical protein